jgi:phage shock protein A
MWKSIKKFWKYLGAKLNSIFNEAADPKIQLEQALTEAQEQHRKLKEQAANVIANQKQTQSRLDETLGQLEQLNRNAQQAVLMADEATRSGDAAKAAEYTSAAEAIANQLIAKEQDVEGLKALALQATQAAEQAKAAVQQNSRVLQQKLAEKQRLLSQLDQAKMQEQMNSAMATLSEQVGDDVPTLAEVKEKIEARHAKAKGMAEIQDMSVESRIVEIEQAAVNVEAQARLSEIRSKLGIGDAATAPAATAAAAGTAAPSGTPAPASETTSSGDGDAPASGN